MRQIAERHGRHVRMLAQGGLERRHECRNLRVDPVLVIDARHQLQAWRDPPGDLPEDLVLLVGAGKARIGAGLTVVVAQILIAGEEPDTVANDRTAEIRREITVSDPLVSAAPLAAWNRAAATG